MFNEKQSNLFDKIHKLANQLYDSWTFHDVNLPAENPKYSFWKHSRKLPFLCVTHLNSLAKMEYTEKWCFIMLETTAINSLLTFTSNTWVFILCTRVIILPLISTWMKPTQPRHTQQHNSIFQGHKCEKHIHCLHSFEFSHIPLARFMQWLEAPSITIDMQLGYVQYMNPCYEKCDLPMGFQRLSTISKPLRFLYRWGISLHREIGWIRTLFWYTYWYDYMLMILCWFPILDGLQWCLDALHTLCADTE